MKAFYAPLSLRRPGLRAAALDAKAHALVDKYARQAEKIYNDVYGRLAR